MKFCFITGAGRFLAAGVMALAVIGQGRFRASGGSVFWCAAAALLWVRILADSGVFFGKLGGF